MEGAEAAEGAEGTDAESADSDSDSDSDSDGHGLRSAVAVHGLLASLLRHAPRDLSLTSLGVLSTLDRCGPRRVTELAALEGVTQPSVTTLVNSLERAGYAERRADPADRRVVLVALTPEGAEYLHSRRRTSAETYARLIARLTPEQGAALAEAVPALERLRELDDEEREPGTPASGPRRPDEPGPDAPGPGLLPPAEEEAEPGA
ncbi:MarR family winged helix-turn-helix transcriptional regulator [Actinacidiphila yeochonensis]|uniref:MarR family winged helix-turn-helix transcriptional regulator n=1 Tax=Actinacidiphila yeochonensis TaxID=89050 RepID=UPI0007C758AE|nr:MarR family transcriptional regulator [Actinacidiphila yeochonensis]